MCKMPIVPLSGESGLLPLPGQKQFEGALPGLVQVVLHGQRGIFPILFQAGRQDADVLPAGLPHASGRQGAGQNAEPPVLIVQQFIILFQVNIVGGFHDPHMKVVVRLEELPAAYVGKGKETVVPENLRLLKGIAVLPQGVGLQQQSHLINHAHVL